MSFARLLMPKNASLLAILGIGTLYFVIPFSIDKFLFPDPYLSQVWMLALLGITGVFLGSKRYKIFGPSNRKITQTKKSFRKSNFDFAIINFVIFLALVSLILVTAESVPILSAIGGGEPGDLSAERGSFLKGRTGILSTAAYAFSVYMASILPFIVVIFFDVRSRLRYFVFLISILVCLCFSCHTLLQLHICRTLVFYYCTLFWHVLSTACVRHICIHLE